MFISYYIIVNIEHRGTKMKLNKNEFLILRLLTKTEKISQREIAKELSISLGTVNKYINNLIGNFLIDSNYCITDKGLKALEPYKAKRAIIMAAGFGSRMVPVTLTIPKPLVKINGTRIIDTIIDALLEKGIDDITIVRGYLKHRFNELLVKYPMLRFIDNDSYNESNNIYSVLLAKDLLSNSYIFDGDLFLYNKEIIEKYQYHSTFYAFSVRKSDDWCLQTKNNIVKAFVRGGENTWQEVPISYWNNNDGKTLAKDIVKVYNSPGGKELLWESVPLNRCNDNYNIHISKCMKEDTIEIDTYNELCEIDSSYKDFSKPKINIEKTTIKNICKTLKCQEEDIHGIEFMKIGLTNVSFKFSVKGNNYVYRKPGENTNKFINRKSEVYSEKIAKKLGMDNTVIHIDELGWKLSRYVENSTQINPYDEDDQKAAMKFIKKLHDAKIKSDYNFDYVQQTNRFIRMFEQDRSVDFSLYLDVHKEVEKIDELLKESDYETVLCHNDYWFWNILKNDKNELTLIDWEYSGNAYPASDVAYFVSSLNFTNDDYLKLAAMYEEHELSKKEKWYYNSVLAIVLWYWFVWALYKEYNGKTIEDKDMWYEKATTAIRKLKGYRNENI